jgi:formyltetrahydrofolate hydrolase
MRLLEAFALCITCVLLVPNATVISNTTKKQEYAEELNILYDALKQKHKTNEKAKANSTNFRENAQAFPMYNSN